MVAELIEYSTVPPMLNLIDIAQRDSESLWGIACVKREYLRPMTNEAFLLTLRSALQDVDAANVFFIGSRRIYIMWNGDQKKIYKQLRNFVGSVLTQPGIAADSTAFISYIDPHINSDELKLNIREEGGLAGFGANKTKQAVAADPFGEDDSDDDDDMGAYSNPQALVCTGAQRERFNETRAEKPYRKQLQILVVEDQIFSQKLLCEIIRSSRSNGQDAPVIDAVTGIHEGWKAYLKKAHDIVFADLGLADGSGHALARAIKELDPISQVVIVTANNFEEELGVARQNNVDGFIAKPYNKKQILDCIDKYTATLKGRGKGVARV